MVAAAPLHRAEHPATRTRPGLVELAVLGTLALLLYHSWSFWFLCDDAFISFRFARNLADGHGLVFNPGFERVEGYTNFLWVLLLSAFDLLGAAPEYAANGLSLTATVGLWGLVVWYAYRYPPPSNRRWLILLPPLLLALTRSVAVWSTSGLETRLFELLIVGGVLRLIVEVEGELTDAPRRPLAWLLLGLATLTRPDGLLISLALFATAAAALRAARRGSIRRAFGPWLGFAALIAAHTVFRLSYYGEWLPNTYYAKVGGRTWWSLGFIYLALAVLEYAAYLWLPLIVAALRSNSAERTLFRPLLMLAAIVPHALYVAAIGGDHFEYRPLSLYFPLLYLLMFDGAKLMARRAPAAALTGAYLAVVGLGLVWLPWQSRRQFPSAYQSGFPGMNQNWADSAAFLSPDRDSLLRLWPAREAAGLYRAWLGLATQHLAGVRQEEHRLFLDGVQDEGRRLKRQIDAGTLPRDVHLATGCVGAIPYITDARVLDLFGLTDAHVAHGPPVQGQRLVAHGKFASPEYLAAARVDLAAYDGVHLLVRLTDPIWPLVLVQPREQHSTACAADVGDGWALLASAPMGFEAARQRLPRLGLRSLANPEVVADMTARCTEALQEHVARAPQDYRARATLAELLFLRGQRSAGLAELARACEMRPDDAELWYRLASARAALGDAVGARTDAERALRLAQAAGDEPLEHDVRELLAALTRAP